MKGESILQRLERTGKHEFISIESVFQVFEKQAAEQTRQNTDRQKETRHARDPAFVTGRQTAARHDTVDMGMML